jgi:hypothetical protein
MFERVLMLVNIYCTHQYVLSLLCVQARRRICADADDLMFGDDRRIDAQSLTLTLATLRTLCITPSPRVQSKDRIRFQRAGYRC